MSVLSEKKKSQNKMNKSRRQRQKNNLWAMEETPEDINLYVKKRYYK